MLKETGPPNSIAQWLANIKRINVESKRPLLNAVKWIAIKEDKIFQKKI